MPRRRPGFRLIGSTNSAAALGLHATKAFGVHMKGFLLGGPARGAPQRGGRGAPPDVPCPDLRPPPRGWTGGGDLPLHGAGSGGGPGFI